MWRHHNMCWTDTFLFISHTTNVLLFKFLCNTFIGVRIIKEMPGSVATGRHPVLHWLSLLFFWNYYPTCVLVLRTWSSHAFLSMTNCIQILSFNHIQYLRQYTTILVFNTTLFCAWRHVSADHTAIFRPTYNRTVPYYIASNMGSHTVYIQCIQGVTGGKGQTSGGCSLC